MQGLGFGVYPLPHVQSVNASLPPAELVSGGQVEQLPVPVAALYFPAAHATQPHPA